MTRPTIAYLSAVGFSVFGLTIFSEGPSASAQSVSFAGPYIGVFGGYGSGASTQRDNGFALPVVAPPVVVPVVPIVPVLPADGDYGIRGGLGGGLVGYNYQFANFVIGAEGDIAATSIKGRSFNCGTPAHECGTSIGAMADVRVRAGLPYGRFMPFVAGGLALDSISAYDTLFGSQGRDFRAGYTVGAGVEYKINAQIAVRVEYLHSQFSSTSLFSIVPGVPERIFAKTDVVRGGIVYSFFMPDAAPVVARY